MQGDPAIISMLNEVLTAELTAINQYFIHAKMCSNWGYDRLAEHSRQESIEEMKHADEIIERILFFEGVPNMQRLNPVRVGETVPEQFQLDLELEYDAVKRFNAGIAACVAASDNTTRALLERILVSEEDHIDWLETQQETISQIAPAQSPGRNLRISPPAMAQFSPTTRAIEYSPVRRYIPRQRNREAKFAIGKPMPSSPTA
jgi:bacterioferritin